MRNRNAPSGAFNAVASSLKRTASSVSKISSSAMPKAPYRGAEHSRAIATRSSLCGPLSTPTSVRPFASTSSSRATCRAPSASVYSDTGTVALRERYTANPSEAAGGASGATPGSRTEASASALGAGADDGASGEVSTDVGASAAVARGGLSRIPGVKPPRVVADGNDECCATRAFTVALCRC